MKGDKRVFNRACVYARVSTEGQADDGYSIGEQESRCRKYIESQGWTYLQTYSDPGISGRTMNRPGLQALMADIKAGKVDAVVIYKLDRLSRKQRDTLTIIEDTLIANDVALVSLSETLDTSTPWGRAMIGILSSFNQMECETIRERTMMGKKAKAQTGGYVGGQPPTGYRVVGGELEIDKKAAKLVREIYKMRYEDDMPYQTIADTLNDRGLRTNQGKKFGMSSIRSILSNRETYLGRGVAVTEAILQEGEYMPKR